MSRPSLRKQQRDDERRYRVLERLRESKGPIESRRRKQKKAETQAVAAPPQSAEA